MNREQVLYDFYHRKLGTIETDAATGNKTAFDFYHRILGFYDSRLDITTDFYHRLIGHGDMLSGLIMEEAKKNGIT